MELNPQVMNPCIENLLHLRSFCWFVAVLGVLAEETSARHDLDATEDVPMIDLIVAPELRERRLQTTTILWCIANPNASQTSLQSSLDWACGTESGQGQVNCGPVNVGGACYDPNTLISHCDWAFNAYFVRMNATAQACDFQGAAMETTTDPSKHRTISLLLQIINPIWDSHINLIIP